MTPYSPPSAQSRARVCLFAVFSPSRPRRVLLNGLLGGGKESRFAKVSLGGTFGWYLCSGMDDDADSGDDVIQHQSLSI